MTISVLLALNVGEAENVLDLVNSLLGSSASESSKSREFLKTGEALKTLVRVN
jgi:hypothetical protein